MNVVCWIDPSTKTRGYESPDGTLHGTVPEDLMKKPMLYFLRHNRDVPSPRPQYLRLVLKQYDGTKHLRLQSRLEI